MTTYRVLGASKETAEDVEVSIEANSASEAEAKANKMGIYVSSVNAPVEAAILSNNNHILLVIGAFFIASIAILGVILIQNKIDRQDAIRVVTTEKERVASARDLRKKQEQQAQINKAVHDSKKKVNDAKEWIRIAAMQRETLRLATLPIDLAMTEWPDGFIGHDLILVYETLHKRLHELYEKSQYDTQSKHTAKLQRALEGELVGAFTVDSTFAFLTNGGREYFPEREEFEFDISLNKTVEQSYGNRYMGFDIYGDTTVDIRKKLYLSLNTTDFDCILKMPPEEAERLDSQMQIFILGKLQSPFLTERYHPQFFVDDLTHVVRESYVYDLDFRIEEIWVVLHNTGKIISKFKKVARCWECKKTSREVGAMNEYAVDWDPKFLPLEGPIYACSSCVEAVQEVIPYMENNNDD